MKRVGHTSEIPFGIYYWKTRKIRILKKWKKIAGDNIISHMCPFTHMQHKSRSSDIWFLRYKFFVIMGHFLPFDPPNNRKNQNFEKIKKPLEMLLFYTCVPQMTTIYCMVPEILSVADIFFFVMLGYFLPFYPTPFPLTAQNIKILKKARKLLEIFYLSTMNKNQKSNNVWFLRYGAQQTEFLSHFGPIFTLPPPLPPPPPPA